MNHTDVDYMINGPKEEPNNCLTDLCQTQVEIYKEEKYFYIVNWDNNKKRNVTISLMDISDVSAIYLQHSVKIVMIALSLLYYSILT